MLYTTITTQIELENETHFLIDEKIAIEVKSSKKVKSEHLAGLKAIVTEGKIKERYLVSFDPIEKYIEGVSCLHWKDFLTRLWSDKMI